MEGREDFKEEGHSGHRTDGLSEHEVLAAFFKEAKLPPLGDFGRFFPIPRALKPILVEWLTTRRATRGPYFDFQEAVTRAMADSQRALERVHHRLSTNGLILPKPRCKIIMTDKGAVIQTKEIDPGPDGKPVYADFWEELSPEAKVKAIEWELRFRDRRTYGDDAGPAGELGGATGDMRQAGQAVGVFAAALELMSQYRVTPALMGPVIETTAKPVEE